MIKQSVTTLVLSNALLMPALAQVTLTWRDTEGDAHTEKQPPLVIEHAKGDPKYGPIIAVARVFSLRFNMAMAGKSNRNESVGTTKRSIEAIPSAWLRRTSSTLGMGASSSLPYIWQPGYNQFRCQA